MKTKNQKKPKTKNWGFDLRNLDTSVRPADDFFHYSCGGWIKQNTIPATEARWGSFDILRQENKKKLKVIVEETSKKKNLPQGSDEQMVRDAYLAGMNETKREKDGAKPIEEIFKKIERIKSAEDIVPLVAFLHKTGFNPLWGMYVDQDERKNDTNILYIGQSGLSLPDRDYYVKDDAESKRVREAYVKYIATMWKISGESAKAAAEMTGSIMKIETKLAKASMTRVERRDIEKQYNKRTIAKFSKEALGVDWEKYLKLVGVSGSKDKKMELIVSQPIFMKRAGELLRGSKDSLPLNEWKTYFKWHVLNGSAGFLSKKFVRENFRFYSTALAGIMKERPLWERVVGFIDGTIGESLGKLYVEKHFDHEAKKKINELVNNLFAAYRERIQALDWMTPKTKKLALKKLNAMTRKLGYPEKWKGYKGLKITPDSYIGNYFRTHEFEWKRMVRKLGKKPDLKEWHMTPSTVNAYNDLVRNEIVFPAGIMQPPFFDPNADDAVNYGAIGAVIGHEITHGFDDQGHQFDAKGNFKNWWTDEDKKKFHSKVKVIEEQYDSYIAIDDMRVNGKLTAGENIADLGGIAIAFAAFKRSQEGKVPEILDGFSTEQRFFLGYSLFEQGIIRPEFLKKCLVTDPHSPAMFRINGPLSNMPEFIESFGVKPGDKLYREPNKRAKIW